MDGQKLVPQQPAPQTDLVTHNPTIPELDLDNITPWIMDIQCEADTLKITSQIEEINYT